MAESDTDGSSSIEELPPAAAKKAKTAEKGAGSKKAKKKKKREPRHKWTQEEDYFLLKAIKDCGSSNWSHTLHALQKDRHQLIWAKVCLHALHTHVDSLSAEELTALHAFQAHPSEARLDR